MRKAAAVDRLRFVLLGLVVAGLGCGPKATPPGPKTYRDSLSVCWHDLSCKRAFLISHQGDWNTQPVLPFDSMAAFQRAYANGADGIKADFRVTRDGVPVVAHSSPIEPWESTDCFGDKIEDMTAAQVTACHLMGSATETFQKVGDVLDWARGKLTVMLTVKDQNYATAIATILAHQAQDFAFIEVRLGDLQSIAEKAPNHDQVWFNAELHDESEVSALLELHDRRVMMVELDNYDSSTVTQTIDSEVHPAGLRAFVMGNGQTSETQQEALFDLGFDVVMTYDLPNGVLARKKVNQARGITPP